MKNLFNYSEYLKEHANSSKEMDELVKTLTDLTISSVHKNDQTSNKYSNIQEIEISEPFLDVDFKVILRKEPNLDISKDPYFENMKWHHVRLKNDNYTFTGNTFMDHNIPSVEIIIVIDSDKIQPKNYEKMYYKLLNTISHELNHLNQKGWNRDYDNIIPKSQEYRKKNGKKHSYFLLPEEIESMVKGMYNQSKATGRPIDELFDEHLQPFVESSFMTHSEMIEIIRNWLEHTLIYYPGANLTDKYSNIMDNI